MSEQNENRHTHLDWLNLHSKDTADCHLWKWDNNTCCLDGILLSVTVFFDTENTNRALMVIKTADRAYGVECGASILKRLDNVACAVGDKICLQPGHGMDLLGDPVFTIEQGRNFSDQCASKAFTDEIPF